ncbi:hypothetical protein C5D35_03460 [Rathayibacter toxicus]|nr:hypothetical protein C5D35_03460 [Rathayibacter toxicus]
MRPDAEGFRYVPLDPDAPQITPAKRLPFDLSQLSVTGLVIICELVDPPPGNIQPAMSFSMNQYLRLSDESMIRLDMDRGLTSFKHGYYTEPVSWKAKAADVLSEILRLIQGDEPDPGTFPWDEYAEAAQLRGISVEAETLSTLPYTILLSDELITIFEF